MKNIILIIEDDKGIAQLCATILSAMYDAEITYTLFDGLERLTKAPPISLILLDLSLPDMSGLNVLKAVQSTHSDVPIVVITGGEYDVEEILGLGAQEFVRKPMTPSELKYAVIKAIARHRVRRVFSPIEKTIEIAKEELDKQDARLTEAEKTIAPEREK